MSLKASTLIGAVFVPTFRLEEITLKYACQLTTGRLPFLSATSLINKSPPAALHLLDQNINTWFDENLERRLIHVIDGNVPAFLSDRYRRLDNHELCATVLPVINDMKGVSNSEVGLGSLRVEPLVFRLVCKNGLICKDLTQKKSIMSAVKSIFPTWPPTKSTATKISLRTAKLSS